MSKRKGESVPDEPPPKRAKIHLEDGDQGKDLPVPSNKEMETFAKGQYVPTDIKEPAKDLRWFYASAVGNYFTHKQFVFNPESHVKVMDEHKLWRPEMIGWLDKAGEVAFKLTDDQRGAVYDYQSDGWYKHVKKWYQDGKPELDDPKYKIFDSIWSSKSVPSLFKGAILWEGQCTGDLVDTKVGDKISRLRVSSTSWSPNAALGFVGSDTKSRKYHNVLIVHEIVDDDISALNVQAISDLGYGSKWAECEVLLQPNTIVEVVAEHFWTMDCYSLLRAGHRQWTGPVRVLFTRVSRAI